MSNQSGPPGASGRAPGLHPILAEFLSSAHLDAEAIAAFLANETYPLIAPGSATFAWFGDADRVDLLRWIHAGVDRTPFDRVSGTDLWVLTLSVEDGGRFEYKIGIAQGGDEHWVLDPLNPARAGDPFGENSVCRTWGYEFPVWSVLRGAPAGQIETIVLESPTFAETREERIYLPADYSKDRDHPLIVIHDGDDFDTYASLSVTLDNLIDAGDIPPVVAVLVQTNDRMGEYAKSRRHARYIVNELLPAITARYRISADATDRVLLGASLGAVAALATAFRFPGVFGGLILNSGSFILDDKTLQQRHHPVFHQTARLVKALRRAPPMPGIRAFISTGELEGLAGENRALASFLEDHGVDVLFKSTWDGHHWHNWRDQLRDGLMWVLRQTR